eukprot:4786902-Prymnesium_polylepis.1
MAESHACGLEVLDKPWRENVVLGVVREKEDYAGLNERQYGEGRAYNVEDCDPQQLATDGQ